MSSRHLSSILCWSAGVVLCSLVACAPQSAGAPVEPGTSAAITAAPAAPKNLTIAVLSEPPTLAEELSPGLTTGGNTQAYLIAHNYLVVRNDQGDPIPQVAQEVISSNDGSWVVNPDGTMDTTWKLRPNVQWQDGMPFTADDMLFSFTVYKDPAIPTNQGAVLKQMASAEAPDPLTFVVHWSNAYADADLATGLIPLPRHVLQDAYDTAKDAFPSSPLLGPQFIGLGPYRLTTWDPGVQMEFSRFDDYFRGRPPFDRVILKFLGDSNSMVTSILSGATDIVLPRGVDVSAAEQVEDRWAGTGNQVSISLTGAVHHVQLQQRTDYAQPAGGTANMLVRQALYNATDRQSVAEVATAGRGPIADGWIPPTSDLYKQVQDAIPQYPFDVTQAQQRFAQAGWVKNAAGVLTSQATGEPLELEIRSSPSADADQMLNATVQGWIAAGVQPTLNIVPPTLSSDAEYRVTFPGAQITGQIHEMFYENGVLDSRQAADPTNRWTGANRSGYGNPAVDTTLDRLALTIDPAEQIALQRTLLQQALGDAAFIPLFWEVDPVLMLQGISGVGGEIDNRDTWNIFEWNKA